MHDVVRRSLGSGYSFSQELGGDAQTNYQSLVRLIQVHNSLKHIAVAFLRRVAAPHSLAAHHLPQTRYSPCQPLIGESIHQNDDALAEVNATQISLVHFGANF